jgi:hypothetical protein
MRGAGNSCERRNYSPRVKFTVWGAGLPLQMFDCDDEAGHWSVVLGKEECIEVNPYRLPASARADNENIRMIMLWNWRKRMDYVNLKPQLCRNKVGLMYVCSFLSCARWTKFYDRHGRNPLSNDLQRCTAGAEFSSVNMHLQTLRWYSWECSNVVHGILKGQGRSAGCWYRKRGLRIWSRRIKREEFNCRTLFIYEGG